MGDAGDLARRPTWTTLQSLEVEPLETGGEFLPLPGFLAEGPGRQSPRPPWPPDAPTERCTVRVVDGPVPVAAARVYVRAGEGVAWFAGWTDAAGRLDLGMQPVDVGLRVLALASVPDSTGLRAGCCLPSRDGPSQEEISLERLGELTGVVPSSVRLPAAVQALVEVESLSPILPGFFAVARLDQTGRVLLPQVPLRGRLRVQVGNKSCEVESADQLAEAERWR